MATPCQKCFTIQMLPAPPFDCEGSVSNIDDAVWDVARSGVSSGGGSAAFAGNSGNISITAFAGQAELWTFSTTLCNPTDTPINLGIFMTGLYNFASTPPGEFPGTAEMTFTVDGGATQVSATCTDGVNTVYTPAQNTVLVIPAFSIVTISGQANIISNIAVDSSSWDASAVFTQPP